VLHPATAQYTFFSAAHGTFSTINHILSHDASLNKYKKIEISPCILPNHNTIKLELNNKRNSRKYSNTWRMNNTLLHEQWVQRNKRKSKSSWNLMRMKAQPIRTCGTQKRQS
jgi:hypothetical protein